MTSQDDSEAQRQHVKALSLDTLQQLGEPARLMWCQECETEQYAGPWGLHVCGYCGAPCRLSDLTGRSWWHRRRTERQVLRELGEL